MRLAAVGAAVDDCHTGLDTSDERHRPVNILRVNRRSETERGIVRQRNRFLEIPYAVQTCDGAEQLASCDLVIRSDMLDDGRRDEISVAIGRSSQPHAAREYDRARLLRASDGGKHVAHLLFI